MKAENNGVKKKPSNEKPISLKPLKFEEAVSDLLKVKPIDKSAKQDIDNTTLVYKKRCVPFNAPLLKQDNEKQTYGCRQRNPEICKFNGLYDVCAFVRNDCMCTKPSRAWASQYKLLLQKQK